MGQMNEIPTWMQATSPPGDEGEKPELFEPGAELTAHYPVDTIMPRTESTLKPLIMPPQD